jgi:hypothetical protein
VAGCRNSGLDPGGVVGAGGVAASVLGLGDIESDLSYSVVVLSRRCLLRSRVVGRADVLRDALGVDLQSAISVRALAVPGHAAGVADGLGHVASGADSADSHGSTAAAG